MGVTETLRILLAIFLSTACIQNVRLFGIYDVRWPFLAEIHTAPLKCFVPSSVLQAVRALRNAPAASAMFLAGVARVTHDGKYLIDNINHIHTKNSGGESCETRAVYESINQFCPTFSRACRPQQIHFQWYYAN